MSQLLLELTHKNRVCVLEDFGFTNPANMCHTVCIYFKRSDSPTCRPGQLPSSMWNVESEMRNTKMRNAKMRNAKMRNTKMRNAKMTCPYTCTDRHKHTHTLTHSPRWRPSAQGYRPQDVQAGVGRRLRGQIHAVPSRF